MKSSARTAPARTAIGTAHAFAFAFWILVLSTGKLSVPGFLLWTAIVLVVDQVFTWSLWAGAGGKGPNPLQGWFGK